MQVKLQSVPVGSPSVCCKQQTNKQTMTYWKNCSCRWPSRNCPVDICSKSGPMHRCSLSWRRLHFTCWFVYSTNTDPSKGLCGHRDPIGSDMWQVDKHNQEDDDKQQVLPLESDSDCDNFPCPSKDQKMKYIGNAKIQIFPKVVVCMMWQYGGSRSVQDTPTLSGGNFGPGNVRANHIRHFEDIVLILHLMGSGRPDAHS
jgi:hypothetical protein